MSDRFSAIEVDSIHFDVAPLKLEKQYIIKSTKTKPYISTKTFTIGFITPRLESNASWLINNSGRLFEFNQKHAATSTWQRVWHPTQLA